MNLERVEKHFQAEAGVYTDHIRRFVPHYQGQNETLLALIPFAPAAAWRFLDLGAGFHETLFTGQVVVIEHDPGDPLARFTPRLHTAPLCRQRLYIT